MNKLETIRQVLPFFLAHRTCCRICPRKCGADRSRNETGFCGVDDLRIYTWFQHTGEEPPISGTRGSGTIFFSGCNLQCVFCQNHQFSAGAEGTVRTVEDCAEIMLSLQRDGAHNINLVTPTHVLPYVIPALEKALERGLTIPLVYNSSGYDLPEVIEKLDGIIDIYLPDLKYMDSGISARYSSASDYPEIAQAALLQMRRQLPDSPVFDDEGIMTGGMIVRHLVLPGQARQSIAALQWIKEHLGSDTLISLMSQYQPYNKAGEFPQLGRRLTPQEYRMVVDVAQELEIDGWIQDEPDESLAGVYFEKK